MEQRNLRHFKSILTGELDRLLSQAQVGKQELSAGSHKEIESLDRIMAQVQQTLNLRIRSRESRLIKKVNLALERIEHGTYGECEECGEPISLKRLEVRPVTTKSMHCKEMEERREAPVH